MTVATASAMRCVTLSWATPESWETARNLSVDPRSPDKAPWRRMAKKQQTQRHRHDTRSISKAGRSKRRTKTLKGSCTMSATVTILLNPWKEERPFSRCSKQDPHVTLKAHHVRDENWNGTESRACIRQNGYRHSQRFAGKLYLGLICSV